MARVVVTKTQCPGANPAAGVAVTLVAADLTDKNSFVMTSDDVLLVYNSGASSYTFTINSVANNRGRTKNITAETITAGAWKVLGPFRSKDGWANGNQLEFEANNAAVKFAVLKLG